MTGSNTLFITSNDATIFFSLFCNVLGLSVFEFVLLKFKLFDKFDADLDESENSESTNTLLIL